MQNSKLDLQGDSKIQLDKDFIRNLGLIHIKLERLNKKKVSTYTYFGFCIVVGTLLILSQRDFLVDFNFTRRRYIELTISLSIILVGFLLSSIAYNKFKKYRSKLKIAREEKKVIDFILHKHQIKYSCNIEFGRKYHGIQDVIVEFKSNSDLLKNSKISYQV